MTDFENQLRLTFFDEAKSMLDEAEALLLRLESSGFDAPTVETIFRLAHNIKGSSAAVGFAELSNYVHLAENLLDQVRKQQRQLNSQLISVFLAFVDNIRAGIKQLERTPQAELHLAPPVIPNAEPSPEDRPDNAFGFIDSELVETPERKPLTPEHATVPPDRPAKSPDRTNPTDESVRVSLERIDHLINNVGEMVILQTALSQQKHLIPSSFLQTTVAQLDKIAKEIQDTVMSLRMVPIAPTFRMLQRVARDTSIAVGKKIKLELDGEDTEVDKSVIEQVNDPLIHLVRNAIDHGLEAEQTRTAVGKSPEGQIHLSARQTGGRIEIEISDDGKGIDPDEILAKAISAGFFTPESRPSREEIIRCIFRPGFSTKSEASGISGRGVGMDIVMTTIEDLQGDIEVKTEVGKGATFRISLPLTLAIIEGMVVQDGDHRFVVPLTDIQESIIASEGQIKDLENGGHILNIRGESLPLYRLCDLLGKGATTKPVSEMTTIIATNRSGLFGLLVDEILGQQQIVIKNLGDELKEIPGVTGGAILSDGCVALILDVAAISNVRRSRAIKSRPVTGGFLKEVA